MTDATRHTRRSALLAVAAAPLAACASLGTEYGDIGDLVAQTFGLEARPGITREQASAIPYASMGYRIGSSGESMLILATQSSGDLLWSSSVHRALMTRAGRIIRSAGFAWNLGATEFTVPDPLAVDPRNLDGQTARRLIDLPDVEKLSQSVVSRFRNAGRQQIEILGTQLSTVAAVEHCRCEGLSWEFDNAYWVDDETGFVWRSRQTIHPNLPSIQIEIFRPPA